MFFLLCLCHVYQFFFFFQAEDGIRDWSVTGVQTCLFRSHHKETIRKKNIRLYFTDMVKIAREMASEADLQMRMQGIVLLGGFLRLTPYAKDANMDADQRSEERRVGKECRSRWDEDG